jgi:hypothetical protein
MINSLISIWRGDFGRIRGRTREQPEAYLYGTLRIATAENEEAGRLYRACRGESARQNRKRMNYPG